MLDTLALPLSEKDFATAKRQFVDTYARMQLTITCLKITVIALCGVCVGLVALNWRTQTMLRTYKPVIIRIDGVGRAEAVNYDDFRYRPQERDIKFFLADFVERHYSRIRATWRQNYSRSLYFLDGGVADSVLENDKKSHLAEQVLNGDEVEVHVTNVVIEDLRTAPYRATVDYEKAYLGQDHTVRRREKFIGNFVFVVKDDVPNALIPVNPLGLTITYFREDQAFQ